MGRGGRDGSDGAACRQKADLFPAHVEEVVAAVIALAHHQHAVHEGLALLWPALAVLWKGRGVVGWVGLDWP